MITVAHGVKSTSAKTVMNIYSLLLDSISTEILILTNASIDEISKFDEKVAKMIAAYRNGTVGYTSDELAGTGSRAY